VILKPCNKLFQMMFWAISWKPFWSLQSAFESKVKERLLMVRNFKGFRTSFNRSAVCLFYNRFCWHPNYKRTFFSRWLYWSVAVLCNFRVRIKAGFLFEANPACYSWRKKGL
jgi:hypothetical protein